MRSRLVDAGRIACFAALMAPSLLASPRVSTILGRGPIALLDVAMLVLLVAAASTASPSLLRTSMLVLLYAGALACAVGVTAVGVTVSPSSVWPPLVAMVVGAFACMHLRGAYRLGVPLLLAAAMGAKVTINAIGWLLEAPDPLAGTGRPAAGRTYVAAEAWYPSRRYRLIHQADGMRLRSTIIHDGKDEVFDLTHLERPPLLVPGGSLHHALVEGTPWVATVERSTGWQLLDRDDLTTVKDIYRGDPGAFYYMGVVYDRQRRRIIGLRSDGRLYFFSYPDLSLVSEQPLPLPPAELGLWQEQFNDMHLLADRYLLVSEQSALGWFPPGLVSIDLETGAARHVKVPGSPGGIATPDDGETFLVMFVGRGVLERRRTDDLSVLWSMPLGFGFRYLTLLPDRRHVAAANFVTGATDVIAIDGGARYGPFQTSPRVDDLAIDPTGRYLDVAHSQGVTRLRVDALLSPPAQLAPPDWFPYWLLRPPVAFAILRDGMANLGQVAVNWLLVVVCTWQFRRAMNVAGALR